MIRKIRKEKHFGVRHIQTHPIHHHQPQFAMGTIHHILIRYGINKLNTTTRSRWQFKSCQKDIPGKRVQLDVFKQTPRIYQYAAIDHHRSSHATMIPQKKD